MTVNFTHSFVNELSGCYQHCEPEVCSSPQLLQLNKSLVHDLGIDYELLLGDVGVSMFSGNALPDNCKPIAQVYAGHQFGMFSSQLGDGRALLLGELVDRFGKRRDIQLKGSGRTPYSRGGDGKAALGPVLREYLVSEAMFSLGVKTTRALAVIGTDDWVAREELKPRAILTRVSSSHMRVGTFEFFAARGEWDQVKKLSDYAIKRHFPDVRHSSDQYLNFFKEVLSSQAKLIADWMSIGFIHGVMNTDNMAISGETIDYGPCAFIDRYLPSTVFSSIDQHGRYAYQNQPKIGQWNLAQLAKALIPLHKEDQETVVQRFVNELDEFNNRFRNYWLENMTKKIGLTSVADGDAGLIEQLLVLMERSKADFTTVFRHLALALEGDKSQLTGQFSDLKALEEWLMLWEKRVQANGASREQCALAMNSVNPIYIPRNHKMEEALDAAVNQSDLGPFTKMLELVTEPYDEQAGCDDYAVPAPLDAKPHVTFCGT